MPDKSSSLPLRDFEFDYPEELIATQPAEPRDSSRLLAVDRNTGSRRHGHFRDLPEFLQPGDCLVINETKVIACRLLGKKSSGGKADILLVKELEAGVWSALSSGLKNGMVLNFPGDITAVVDSLNEEGEYVCRFSITDLPAYLERHGLPPLPPYIAKRKAPDRGDLPRYQTVYARCAGSIAAPTAGLHFTPELLEKIKAKGVCVASLTLHVGRGTFRPISTENAAAHRMLPEWYSLDKANAALITAAKKGGRRVLTVGTTATRTLETLARRLEGFGPGSGLSDLYIYPGHEFKIVNGLITNFHLPQSTPLLLAAALLGREKLLEAYQEAVSLKYRLYSFGDAMLIH